MKIKISVSGRYTASMPQEVEVREAGTDRGSGHARDLPNVGVGKSIKEALGDLFIKRYKDFGIESVTYSDENRMRRAHDVELDEKDWGLLGYEAAWALFV